MLLYIAMGIGAGFCVAGAVGAAILGRSSKKGAGDSKGEPDSVESPAREQAGKSAQESTNPEALLVELAELAMRYRQLTQYAREWQEDAKQAKLPPPTTIRYWEPFITRWSRASHEEVEEAAGKDNEVEREFNRIVERNREPV
jgi:hypothetical protein